MFGVESFVKTFWATLAGMEVHFGPEKEEQLQRLALRTGRNAEQVVEEAVDRLLGNSGRFKN